MPTSVYIFTHYMNENSEWEEKKDDMNTTTVSRVFAIIYYYNGLYKSTSNKRMMAE